MKLGRRHVWGKRRQAEEGGMVYHLIKTLYACVKFSTKKLKEEYASSEKRDDEFERAKRGK